MSRKTLVPIVLVAVVVILIGANLALREDPEPQLDSVSLPSEARSPARPQREGPGEDDDDAQPGRSGALEQEELSGTPGGDDEDTAGAEGVVGCDHPLIVASPGQTRAYRWVQSGEDRTARLTLSPRRTRQRPGGQREIRWAVQVLAEDDASELAEATLTTRCAPGQDAEEPWFGILERALGLTLTDAPGRWRWPAELEAGQRFEGTATFDPSGSEMRTEDEEEAAGPRVLRITRRHVVEARERVQVPAGRFSTWRVSYEERHAFGDRGETGTGTLWVASDVGLVKSRAENSRGVVQTLELTSLGE